MPIVIGLQGGLRFRIKGKNMLKHTFLGFLRPWIRGVETPSGNAACFRRSRIEYMAYVPQEQLDAADKKKEEDQKEMQRRNPNPGRNPRVVIPGQRN